MRNWPRLVCSLMLSLGIWFIHNISQPMSDIVSVSVVAESNIPGRSQRSSEAVPVIARCTAQGYVFMYSRMRKSPVVVYVDPDCFTRTSDDKFSVSSSELVRYSKQILPDFTVVESFLKESYTFVFTEENCKKVPVRLMGNLSFKSQYMAAGSPVINPDSVLVYGRPETISSVEYVLTRPVNFTEVSHDVHNVIKLEKIPGVRCSEQQVSYNIDVVRFVEIRSKVRIVKRNVPTGCSFSIYPTSADAIFRCEFPMKYNPSDPSEFYVDYDEFLSSISGKCMIRCDGLPPGVKDWSIEPEYCECILEDIAL